jgi:hypothetical protein
MTSSNHKGSGLSAENAALVGRLAPLLFGAEIEASTLNRLLDAARKEGPVVGPGGEVSGWVLVPREPTEAMLQAGIDCPRMKEVGQVLVFAAQRGVQIKDEEPWPLQQAYAAMLSAAPPPPVSGKPTREEDPSYGREYRNPRNITWDPKDRAAPPATSGVGELDLAALEKVAREAAEHLPGEWRTGTDEESSGGVAFLDRHAGEERWLVFAHCSGGCLEWISSSAHVATFDPPTILKLLATLTALAEERDEARRLAEGRRSALASHVETITAERAAKQAAEEQRDRLVEAVKLAAPVVEAQVATEQFLENKAIRAGDYTPDPEYTHKSAAALAAEAIRALLNPEGKP